MPQSLWILILSLIITARLFFAPASFTQSQYRFQHLTADDGLPNGNVISIRTDSLGYVFANILVR